MTEYFIERTGEPPLKFSGELLGDGTTKTADYTPRWTEVRIYRTAGGKFIAEVKRITTSSAPHGGEEKTYTDAQAFPCATDVISYLRQDDENRKLGLASQAALKKAAAANQEFKATYVEIVD